MGKKSALQILDDAKPASRSLNRREWIARMMGGATAGIALPGLAGAHPVREHLAHSSTLDMADAQVAAATWAPEFMDAHQAETLAVLGERIVPGSSRAHVERFIDTLLSVDRRENQQRFLNSLAAFEGESLQKHGHPFKDLTEAQQNEILTVASTGKPGHAPYQGRRRAALGPPPSGSLAEHDTFREHFENLKGWVVGAYYTSEVGMRELGWTGQVMFESFPGCEHPGGHA
ncbi:MAG: gluconate 2-dehydrogenase subunit 3 family protein [Terriglobia bacterium]